MYFVSENSIVRKIWGSADTILFIFAGASAEFALNKAVDWLYFTGKLPADPIGRLFSTVEYSRRIVFSKTEDAHKAIDQISNIHRAVETNREDTIPEWAYRDVLYMLIDYSIRSYETLHANLTGLEKVEVYDVFYRMGSRMQINALPSDYSTWLIDRDRHLMQDLVKSKYTEDLFKQYHKHLGSFRYYLLVLGQSILLPEKVRTLLNFGKGRIMFLILIFYKMANNIGIGSFIMSMMMPALYRKRIMALNLK